MDSIRSLKAAVFQPGEIKVLFVPPEKKIARHGLNILALVCGVGDEGIQ
jgi:hypothetical protein